MDQIILIILLICGLITSFLAFKKGYSFGWGFLWGFLFSVIAMAIYCCLPAREHVAAIEVERVNDEIANSIAKSIAKGMPYAYACIYDNGCGLWLYYGFPGFKNRDEWIKAYAEEADEKPVSISSKQLPSVDERSDPGLVCISDTGNIWRWTSKIPPSSLGDCNG